MAANVETMFYVREKPWHGLGVRVEEAQTSEEALKVAGLDWNVNQFPVIVNGKEAEGYIANVRDKDNTTLGIVSDRYKIVQNREAFAFTDALLQNDCVYETAGSLNKGKKIWLLARMPETQILNDEVSPYLCFTSTHDGTGSIKCCITPIRVVCQNTLNLALSKASRTWSSKHMGDIEGKFEEANLTLELANNYMKELGITAEKLANQIVSRAEYDEFVEELFPLPTEKVTDRKIENVITIRKTLDRAYLKTFDIRQYVGTAYGVINAVSDMVTHSTPIRNTVSYKERMFGKVIEGHEIIDRAYKLLVA